MLLTVHDDHLANLLLDDIIALNHSSELNVLIATWHASIVPKIAQNWYRFDA